MKYISIKQGHPLWGILVEHGKMGKFVYLPLHYSVEFNKQEITLFKEYGLAGKMVYVCKRMYLEEPLLIKGDNV